MLVIEAAQFQAAHVVVRTNEFDPDLTALVDDHGFRIDAIFPADAPSVAIVSGYGVRLRLERVEPDAAGPATIDLLTDDAAILGTESVTLPGGSELRHRPFTTNYVVPEADPSFVLARRDDPATWGVGRAGMRYRDLLPDRWGGRFIASHITIPDGGPVPDYVHFHKVRFQMIFVKSGWVRLVYEDQGAPFVMHAGDCVLQPPEIRHRVLESSPHLEVIEIGCPADHETIADHATPLPTPGADPDRDFSGQRFVRHVAAGAPYERWRIDGFDHRDTGIGDATNGLAGARIARHAVDHRIGTEWISHDTEFCSITVLDGGVTLERDGATAVVLGDGDSVAIPGMTRYRLTQPTGDLELLDVTLPAEFRVLRD